MKNKFLALILSFVILVSVPSTSIAAGLLTSVSDNITTVFSQQLDNLKSKINSITDITGNVLDELVTLVTTRFKDVKKSAWYTETISTLVGLGILDGYPDNTLRPSGTLQVDQFTKMLVASLGYKVENSSGYWATSWIAKAEELGIIQNGEFTANDYKKNINRGQMARMIVRAMELKGEKDYPADINNYAKQLNDYSSIPSQYREYVLKAYVKGIVTGYGEVPNVTFQYSNNATRAEAATMIVRLLDKSIRQVPELKNVEENGVIIIEGIRFNPINDVDPNYGTMKREKAKEFEKKFFNSLKFNKQNNSLDGYVPKLPEGFWWDLGFIVDYDPKYKVNQLNMETFPEMDSLKQGEKFSVKLRQGDWSKVVFAGVSAKVKSEGGSEGETYLSYPSMKYTEK